MSDWTEAAVDTAIRAQKTQREIGALSAGTTTIRVPRTVKAELIRIQEQIRAEHGWSVSLGNIIRQALADRKAWRAMGDAALAADRKPVPS